MRFYVRVPPEGEKVAVTADELREPAAKYNPRATRTAALIDGLPVWIEGRPLPLWMDELRRDGGMWIVDVPNKGRKPVDPLAVHRAELLAAPDLHPGITQQDSRPLEPRPSGSPR